MGAADRQAGPDGAWAGGSPGQARPARFRPGRYRPEAIADASRGAARATFVEGGRRAQAPCGHGRVRALLQGIDRIARGGAVEAAAAALAVCHRRPVRRPTNSSTFLATDIDKNGEQGDPGGRRARHREDDDGRMLRTVQRIAGLRQPPGAHRRQPWSVFSGAVGMRFRRRWCGRPVNLAARLMAAAPGAAPAPAVVGRCARLATTALRRSRWKGRAAPVAALALGSEAGTRAAAGGDLCPS